MGRRKRRGNLYGQIRYIREKDKRGGKEGRRGQIREEGQRERGRQRSKGGKGVRGGEIRPEGDGETKGKIRQGKHKDNKKLEEGKEKEEQR